MGYLEHMARRLSHEEGFVPGSLGMKDKVREFARMIGVQTPRLYFRGPIQDLPKTLPTEFVLKPEFASTSIGVRLLRTLDESRFHDLVSRKDAARTDVVKEATELAERYSREQGSDSIFIVEELLRGRDGGYPPPDIRCYSFQGEIGMILMEHHISGVARAMYFDGHFHPFPDLEERYGIADGMEKLEIIEPAVAPSNASNILRVARRISVAVPSSFVRIDLYDTPEGIYLGELTFYPGTFYYKNRKLMSDKESRRLGLLWDNAAERLGGSHDARGVKR